jgi:hypothetical protein
MLWLVLAAACSRADLAAAADQAPPEIVRGGSSPAERSVGQRRLHASLAADMPFVAAPPIRAPLTSQERRELQENRAAGPEPLRVGLVKTLSPGVVVSGFERQRIAKRRSAVAGGVLGATIKATGAIGDFTLAQPSELRSAGVFASSRRHRGGHLRRLAARRAHL